MNIYGVLLLVVAVGVFVYSTGMAEPFGFIVEQFNSIFVHIKTNNIMFNSIVLALVIALLAGLIKKLFTKNEKKTERQIIEQIIRDQQQIIQQEHNQTHRG